MSFFSTTLTPSTTVQNLMANRPGVVMAVQATVVVRSMGTATYIALGGIDTQDRRLTKIGDGISITTAPGRNYFNPSALFVSSDTSDAVIEILGEAFDCPLQAAL